MFTVLCRYAHSDWQSTEAFLYVIGKSNIMSTWKYFIVIDIKGKRNFNFFTTLYIHIVEISKNKGANSYKLKIAKNKEYFLT